MVPMWLVLVASIFLAALSVEHAAGKVDKKALYFLDNNPAGASIVSLKISNKDGKLSYPKRTPTGGKGLLALAPEVPVAGSPIVPDSTDTLFSQDSVVVHGNYLFVVNPGSNTLSFFLIDEKDPTSLTLAGAPADTLGEFPISVTYSPKLKTACVLNGGKVNGVTCFSVDSVTGLTVLDKFPRHLSVLNTTTPPVGVSLTASDIVFNPSSTALFVTIKGNNYTYRPIVPGHVYTWPVVNGRVSYKPNVVKLSQDVAGPFSIQFVGGDDSKFYVSDFYVGGAIFKVSPAPEFKITLEKVVYISINVATCWTSYSPLTKAIYFTDLFLPNITVLDTKTDTLSYRIDFPTVAPPGTNFSSPLALNSSFGGTDTVTYERYIYILTSSPHIAVVDIFTRESLQFIDLSALGNRQAWKGLAMYS